ncbi:hypothetical protein QTI24_29285 [Variovorax sp. J22P240]|uniref:hypothetical protein n=1 Tax=Variovorax sp. J22P240 TaxID=3053514 RepID=UPI002575FEEB|nr:hypothetical protein [Variovorax sp. J22P240]MDM0002725.1 hypothetical protein [Variovorax sp. J22P240]
MGKAASATLQGDLLSVQPYRDDRDHGTPGRTFLLEVKDAALSSVLMSSLSMLDRLLVEKMAAARERHMEEVVDFMTERLLVPSTVEMDMAQRLATRHARVLNEFGYLTAEQLADANRSQAGNRAALAANWRKRRQIFAVPHPEKAARERDVYPAFQFEEHKPIKAVHDVLEAFGAHKAPWKLALWFTSNNGWLPGSARPVDLLTTDSQAVIAAAKRDAQGSAA